jgi:hypothetical protein
VTASAFRHRNFKRDQHIMKVALFLLFIALFTLLGAGIKKPAPAIATKQPIELKDTIDFTKQVQPIMIKNCSPCHFTGGKMYDRMPFDKDTTIINHATGILKRIKGDENALLKTFIQQNNSSSHASQ